MAAGTAPSGARALGRLPRLWKSLGKSQGKVVRIAQYYAQKSSVDATKVVVAQGFLLDHSAVGRESAGPSGREPETHLAVGPPRAIEAGSPAARLRAKSPGHAAVASRPRRPRVAGR